MKPRLLSSRIAHQNKWYKVRHDELEWAPDKKGEYFVVEGWEGVAIIAIQSQKILIINQYRYPVDTMSMELPMGRVEADEDILNCAFREFEEEAGHRAGNMKHLATTYIGIGFANIPLHIFQAENIVKTKQVLDDSEQSMTAEWIDLNTWERKITHGEIIDNESLACWAIYSAQCFR